MNKAVKLLSLVILVIFYGQQAKADCINGNLTACMGTANAETYTLNAGDFVKATYSYSGGTKIAGGGRSDGYITIAWNESGWHTLTVEELDPNNPRSPCTINIYVKLVAGGTLSNSTTVCQGSSTTLTLTGYAGLIQQWERTTDGSTWEVIGHTGASYNTGALSTTTSYRVLVSECGSSGYSSLSGITVSVPNAGNVSGGGTAFCTGESVSGRVSVSNYGGSVMTWEKSEYTGGTWTGWSDTGSPHDVDYYDYSVSVRTRFRARISSGVCGTIYSGNAEILEMAPTIAGAISGPAEICSGVAFSLSLNGYSGTILGWYKRDAAHGYGGDIGTPNNITISTSTYFKAVVKNGSCTSAETPEFYVYVKPAPSGGALSAGSAICAGESRTLTLTGFAGSIVRWEKTTDGSNWQPISYTSASYTTGGLSSTTTYRVIVRNDCSVTATSPSSTITVSVPNPGSVSGGGTAFCTGEAVSGRVSVSNYGGIVMTWEKSEYSNGAWGNWSDTGSPHGIDYYDYSVSVRTRFHAKISSGVCGTIYSGSAEIQEIAPSEAGYISGPSEVCSGAPFSLTLVGGTGTAVWYMRDAEHEYGPIGGSPTGLAITRSHWYKAVVQSAGCTTPDEAEIYVAVRPTLFVSIGPAYQEICPGGEVNLLTLETSALPVKWQRKDEGSSTWSTVATGIAPGRFSFSPVNASGQWRAAVTNECGDTPSDPVEVEMLDAIPAPQITNVSVCPGETAVLSVSNPQPAPTRYVWYSFSNGQYTVLATTGLNEYRIADPTNATYSVAFERLGCTGPKSPVQVTMYNSAQVSAAPYINVTATPTYNVKIYKNNPSAEGVSFYWQTQPNGKDVSNEADVIDVPVTGLHYVRARNSSGCWGGVSEPVEVVSHLPSQTQYAATQINYVRTYTFLEPSTVTVYPADLDTESDPLKMNINSTYIDGLGRPVQSVQKKGSPTGNDQVTVVEYDEAGRKVRDYLPYTAAEGNGNLKTAPFPEQRSFYGTEGKVAASYFPFSYQQAERSPLDRAQASYPPGSDCAGLVGSAQSKKVEHHYLSNTLADNVRLWLVDAQGSLFTNSNYAEGSLFVNETIDEHGFRVREFKTKEDKLVLKRVQVAQNLWADTYYVYDDFGNLAVVLPPEAVKKMEAIINQN